MESREKLINRFVDLSMGFSDRMEQLIHRFGSSPVVAAFDRSAESIIDQLTALQEKYMDVIDAMDTVIHRQPPSRRPPRGSNVVSFRPRARRKP